MKTLNRNVDWLCEISGLTVDEAIAYLHTLQGSDVLCVSLEGDTYGVNLGSDLEYKVPYTKSELEQMAQDRKQKKISDVQKRIAHFEKLLRYDHIPAEARQYYVDTLAKSKIELESMMN